MKPANSIASKAMKSPSDIALRLARQWHSSPLRVERLLSKDSWPLDMPIGKPTGAQFSTEIARVQSHVQAWRQVEAGKVIWEAVNYRASAGPVSLPIKWRLNTPSEWVAATSDTTILDEYRLLEAIISNVSPIYRERLIAERPLWRSRSAQDVISTATLVDSLTPGIANGKPLRLVGGLDVDTKFFERNSNLITRLLDERYGGAASEQGLHSFLDAPEDKDHWLLVVPLQSGLLPFSRQRVTAQELAQTAIPAKNILVVENEKCLHLLPIVPDTVAILGAGLDLQWLAADTFFDKRVAYWGDMDTWGLTMLARARQHRPDLSALMMTRSHFEACSQRCAVAEPTPAPYKESMALNDQEKHLYQLLITLDKGRLEQEYLPEKVVHEEVRNWIQDPTT